MYPQPFVPALAGPREYPFAPAFPLRVAWLRPVEDVRRALRKGKWIAEEEEYTQKIIECFNKGFLNIAQGTTLRSCLSEKLNCDPMRITKKFAGSSCIGKQVYQPCEKTPENLEAMKKAQAELSALERKFLAKVEHVTRPHRFPYIVYGAEPLSIASDAAPVDMFRGFPLAPHSDPYVSYAGMHAGMSPPRTFFPSNDRAARPSKAEVFPRDAAEGAVSESTDPAQQDRPESRPAARADGQPDLEGSGLLLSFAKSASNEQRSGQAQQEARSEKHVGEEEMEGKGDKNNGDDAGDAECKEERQTEVKEHKRLEAPEEQDARRETHAPTKQSAAASTPKRPSTMDEASLSNSRKRRVPESFAAQAYSQAPPQPPHLHYASATASASYAHARAAAPGAVDHRVPMPPVPPLDFQSLRNYPYLPSRSYLPEYTYPPYLTDPLRRVPFSVYDSAHYRAAAHAAHVQHSLAGYPPPPPASYGAMPGHPELADVHLYGPPPPPAPPPPPPPPS